MSTPGDGERQRRREDPALVTGRARYTDDHQPEGVLHAALLRSEYGHALVEQIDVTAARERDGVVAVFTGADLAERDAPLRVTASSPLPDQDAIERPLLASHRVRYTGDPVAIVLAEDRYTARDAREDIAVEYQRLPAVTDPRDVASGEAPPDLDTEGPSSDLDDIPDANERGREREREREREPRDERGWEIGDTIEWEVGDETATSRAFDATDHVVALELRNQRLCPAPMEPRGVLAEYEPDERNDSGVGQSGDGGTDQSSDGETDQSSDGETDQSSDAESLTVTASTQAPHSHRDLIADALGLSASNVRVRTPAVGGGFGTKLPNAYLEGPLVAWCAMETGRPVKWVATRTEGLKTDRQGRGVQADAELALDADGRIRGLRIRGYVAIGGYPLRGPSSCLKPELLTGAYRIPSLHCRVTGAITNTAPLGPYRGAGRPEAIYVVERLIDRAAAEVGLDAAEIRRRNFVPPSAFPYETATGTVYDSGDYERALDRALDAIGDQSGRWCVARSGDGDDDRLRGVGIASFVEHTGSTKPERARIEIDGSGTVRAYCGTTDQGQGHATTFARLIADELGVSPDVVEFFEGDTAHLDDGTGTFGSRSTPIGGSALVECAREIVDRGRKLAAAHLEAPVDDVRFDSGTYHVEGAPDRSVAVSEIARMETSGSDGTGLSATTEFQAEGYAFAFGTHVAVVAVDPATGDVDVERYVAVDDCGPQIAPTLVEGQVHGAVAQGIGQALFERAVYDDAGTLVTGSLQDYALPRATDLPAVETDATVTPSPRTPTGAKGVGEAGTIAAPPAIANAVVDALSPLGVDHDDLDMPLTAERVWQVIDAADGGDDRHEAE